MCARYVIAVDLAALAKALEAEPDFDTFSPRYNLAPTDMAPIAVEEGDTRRLVQARFGFAPRGRRSAPVVNARRETAATLPTFRNSFRRHRCLVPADGFYEWRREGRMRSPFFAHLEGQPFFVMAGLRLPGAKDDEPPAFAILTQPAAGPLATLHDRMPVLLSKAHADAWIDPDLDDIEALEALLDDPLAESLILRRVDPQVNDVHVDDPSCTREAEPRIRSLFEGLEPERPAPTRARERRATRRTKRAPETLSLFDDTNLD